MKLALPLEGLSTLEIRRFDRHWSSSYLAFASARTVLVRVPRQCPPADLLEALRRDGRL